MQAVVLHLYPILLYFFFNWIGLGIRIMLYGTDNLPRMDILKSFHWIALHAAYY